MEIWLIQIQIYPKTSIVPKLDSFYPNNEVCDQILSLVQWFLNVRLTWRVASSWLSYQKIIKKLWKSVRKKTEHQKLYTTTIRKGVPYSRSDLRVPLLSCVCLSDSQTAPPLSRLVCGYRTPKRKPYLALKLYLLLPVSVSIV